MMEPPNRKIGRLFIVFAGICLLALPLVVMSAFSRTPMPATVAAIDPTPATFDQGGAAVFDSHDRAVRDYLEGTSTERTLAEYYARRQYLGSPPFIPHELVTDTGTPLESCIACHEKGGWAATLNRHSPVTPHPDQVACRQCHIPLTTKDQYVAIDWKSVRPPRLGRSYLPGGPPPIPHTLQMRGDCVACHVGPAAVVEIRVDHPSRGNCRQCHVPDPPVAPFQRTASLEK